MRSEQLGGLVTHLAGGTDREGGGDGPLVVLFHGFGAPGTDLVGLSRVLSVPREVRFAFPEAPLPLPEFPFPARAWWRIDLSRFEERRGEADALSRMNEVPDGLDAAREKAAACLDALQTKLGVSGDKIVLGGFSQGAMVACDLALSDTRPLAGLALMSTTLICAESWRARMPQRKHLPVFQSHGHGDALLPYRAAERLRELWTEAGGEVDFAAFRGGHEIPQGVLDRLSAFIARCVS